MTRTSNWAEPNVHTRLGINQVIGEQGQVGRPPTVRTTPYTLTTPDVDRNVEMNSATPVLVTVPAGVFVAGHQVTVVQTGAGLVTLAAGAGLTLNSPTTLKSNGQWASLVITFRSGSTAVLSGNISAT